MYYTYPCPVCGVTFFTFTNNPQAASQTLYSGIESHMKNYQELERGSDNLDHVGQEFEDLNTVYKGMSTSDTKPEGGYDLG